MTLAWTYWRCLPLWLGKAVENRCFREFGSIDFIGALNL